MDEYIFQEVSLDDVLKYFANGFDKNNSRGLHRTFGGDVWHEAFVDTAKRKVIFKLAPSESSGG
ncbi:MAG TPA: hypothetical protein VFI62_03375 [Burkholderiales bacterium]|nr:hypothetical protein [Burkholderiales bacterium]